MMTRFPLIINSKLIKAFLWLWLIIVLLSFCISTPRIAHAQDFDYGTVAINHLGKISESTHLLALNFKLNKGWKIYWHSGGETALPPSIVLDEESQEKVKHINILWPYPQEITFLNISSLGYKGDITLPVEVNLPDSYSYSSQPLIISGTLHYPVCATICIPAQKPFSISLDDAINNGDRLKQAINNVPIKFNAIDGSQFYWTDWQNGALIHGNLLASQTILEQSDLKQLKNVIISYRAPDEYRGFYLLPRLIKQKNTDKKFNWQFIGQNFISLPPNDIAKNQPLPLLLTAEYQGQYIQTNLVANYRATPPLANAPPRTMSSVWVLALLALLAGLLLNLMPCVLPVLSLKLLPIAKINQTNITDETIREFRENALLSGLGMIIGFQLLAFLLWLIGLNGFVGWGAQFQSPLFLLAMIWVLLLFIAIEMGWQQFRLPFTNYLSNVGNYKATKKHHAVIHKLTTGVVIAWLASSCTAPIIGTIVGAAIAGGTAQLFLLLGLLSFGMASPYLLIALNPNTVHLLPKSGKWNQWLRYGVTSALLLTAIWLFWLLSFHLSNPQKIAFACICTLLLGGAYLKHRGIGTLDFSRFPLFTMAIPLLILTGINTQQAELSRYVNQDDSPLPTQIFAPEKISALLDDDKLVIVDITANWCITCKFNDARVWNSKNGRKLLNQNDLIFMRGDWTLPNAEIEKFLSSYQHYAIPFTIIYTQENRQGTILSEFYTLKQVKNALYPIPKT